MGLNSKEIGRQAVHFLGSLLVIVGIYLGSFYTGIASLSACLFLYFLSWWTREKKKIREKVPLRLRKIERLEDKSHEMINSLEREYEIKNNPYQGAQTFFLSLGLIYLVFPLKAAILSNLILSVCDSVSTIIGVHFGRHQLPHNNRKSFEGSSAFFAFAFVISLYFMNLLPAILLALVITFVETLSVVDDNLSIPFFTVLIYVLIII